MYPGDLDVQRLFDLSYSPDSTSDMPSANSVCMSHSTPSMPSNDSRLVLGSSSLAYYGAYR